MGNLPIFHRESVIFMINIQVLLLTMRNHQTIFAKLIGNQE